MYMWLDIEITITEKLITMSKLTKYIEAVLLSIKFRHLKFGECNIDRHEESMTRICRVMIRFLFVSLFTKGRLYVYMLLYVLL